MDKEKIIEIAQEVGITAAQAEQVLKRLIDEGIVEPSVSRGLEEVPSAAFAEKIKREFATAKRPIKRRDIYAAAREAREKSQSLFEDQGIASMALVFSDLFANLIESPEKVLERSR